jgi:carboxyl-terminal processing protease
VDVYYAEIILKLLGYQIEFPDMLLEAGTVEVIADYQRHHNLKVSGYLDLPTQKSLNNEIYPLTLKYDKAYAKAVELLK